MLIWTIGGKIRDFRVIFPLRCLMFEGRIPQSWDSIFRNHGNFYPTIPGFFLL